MNNRLASFIRLTVFFALVASIVTVAVVAYGTIEAYVENTIVIALVMLIVVLFLSALLTLIDYLRNKYTVEKRVEDILKATNAIASGDFSIRLSTHHRLKYYDQFDYINENINKMAAELGRMEVIHVDFVSNLSHEIKTPLAVIQNYATSLQNTSLDEKTKQKYASTLGEAAKRLTILVTNILKLNKLDNQDLIVEKETFNLSEALVESVLSFEDLIEQKNIDLICDIKENVMLTSSPSYLEIVWNNLLSNAIKFTEPNGTITITLKEEEQSVIVSFKDTGCGMNEETGKHIFDKFYQGDTSHATEGNGLGLALVKRVIDRIGGTISVNSELNVGSTFTIELDKNARIV